jgi:hypothetical protein
MEEVQGRLKRALAEEEAREAERAAKKQGLADELGRVLVRY